MLEFLKIIRHENSGNILNNLPLLNNFQLTVARTSESDNLFNYILN